MMAVALAAGIVGFTLGLLAAALCQISRESDARTERIWQGVRRSMDRVRETCRHCDGNHLDTDCESRAFASTDAECMAIVVRGWPEPYTSRRIWRERPVA